MASPGEESGPLSSSGLPALPLSARASPPPPHRPPAQLLPALAQQPAQQSAQQPPAELLPTPAQHRAQQPPAQLVPTLAQQPAQQSAQQPPAQLLPTLAQQPAQRWEETVRKGHGSVATQQTWRWSVPSDHRTSGSVGFRLDLKTVCWVTLWLAAALSITASAGSARHHQPPGKIITSKGINPDEFLLHFGYLAENHDLWRHFRRSRKKAVSLYQQTNGLTVTGTLDKPTWRLMQRPRCGNPDIVAQTLPDMRSGNQTHSRIKRYVSKKAQQINTYDYKWLQRSITWRPTRFFHKLSVYTQWRVLKKAFDTWSEPSQLTVNYDPTNPDIRVSFWSREHGDGDGNAFDGEGQLLAHAFPPGEVDLAGDIHFDADEPWTVGSNSPDSKDLLMIAMHEAGHAVGLSHSVKKRDVMYPVYGSYTSHPRLSKNDVRRLQYLYGKNPAYKWIPPPKKVKKPPKVKITRLSPRWCRMHFNDVISGPYGRGYIFSKRYVYRFSSKGLDDGYPVHIKQEFPSAPINPLAVVHVREGTKTYFFKGKRFWRYSNYTLEHGYPRRLHTAFPETPRAALNLRDRKGHSNIYIFGTRFFWQWSHISEDVSSSFLFIKDFWGGLPDKVDAAVQWSDNYIYFFRRKKYYKVSRDNHDLMLGYPKLKGPAWLRRDCGYEPK